MICLIGSTATKSLARTTSTTPCRQRLFVLSKRASSTTSLASSSSSNSSAVILSNYYRCRSHRPFPRLHRLQSTGTARSSSSNSSKRQKATLAGDATTLGGGSSSSSSSTSTTMGNTTNNAGGGEASFLLSRGPGRSLFQSLKEALHKPRTIPIPRWITPRHYTITLSECFGHSSFLLVALSYAVDDFLMLRIIAVAGSTAMLFFTYFHPHGRVLWLPFKWNALFIAINSYRIGKVYLDRYVAARLPDELMELRERDFYLMDPVDFSKLVSLGTVREYKKGERVIMQGKPNRYIRLVLNGELKVLRDGKLTYTLQQGNFVSELGLHSGLFLSGEVESCCSIVANSDTRILTWDRSELIALMRRDAGVRRSLKAILSWDIIRKLKAQRNLLTASGSSIIIDDPEEWTERRKRQSRHRYASILHNILTSDPRHFKERREELAKYRTIHHIDEETHNMALEDEGWTPEEFDAGHKMNNSKNGNRKFLGANGGLRWMPSFRKRRQTEPPGW